MSDDNSNDNQGDCFHVSEDGSAIKYDDKEYDLVPASYWLSLGYSEYAANTIMLNFQINMHKMRREIMNGGGTCAECGAKFLCVSMEQSYDADGNLPENKAYTKPFFIKYDDILRHEWQLTMNVLSEVTGPITSFSVANVELPADIMNMVVSALQDKQPREIRLCNNILGKEGILSVTKIVENAPSLEYLLLDGNEMSDRNCFIGLLGAIKAHPVPMKLVSIEGCAMGNIDIMSELLPVMENVVFLDLSANGLTDDAAKVIAGALKTNSNLKRLHLFRNAIGKAGLEALFQAIFDTRSMNSIIESNHSCDIYAGGIGGSIISLLEYDVGGLKVQFIPSACCGYEIMLNYPLGISDPGSQTEQQIRLHKVYLALGIDQPQSFNSKLLCDLPLAIMPKLLEWVQKASEEIAARTTVDQEDTSKDDSGLCLKNIFEVVKNCIVPMAYA